MPKWTEWQKLRVTGKEEGVPWWVNDKIQLNKFLVENGFPTPVIHQIWKRPSDIDLANMPSTFVLKPSVMHSAAGVMVLERVPDDSASFKDQMTGSVLTETQIKTLQTSVYDRCQFKGSYNIFAEERVVPEVDSHEIPLDYKVFCFDGVPRVISQIDRNGKPYGFSWFDGSFSPLKPEEIIESDWKRIRKGAHVVPESAKEMLQISSAVSSRISSPFISVDMYAAKRGPLIGELTPAPGGPYYGDLYRFTDDFDADLGAEWKRALDRLSSEGK